MADPFDRILFELAEESDKQVDYIGMYQAVRAAERQRKAKQRARLRSYGTLAACLMVLCAVGVFASRGGFKAAAEVPAAEAAPAPAAPAAAAYAMAGEESAAAAAVPEEVAVAQPAAQAVYDVQASAAAEDGEATITITGNGRMSDLRAMAPQMITAPLTRLINRTHPMGAEEVPADMQLLGDVCAPNLTLKKTGMQANTEAMGAFGRMLLAAANDGVDGFYLVSAYRSYEEQAAIWNAKVAEDPDYGANGAPVASMPPGQSEHQSGLAFDITSDDHRAMSAAFSKTEQAQWLRDHAHEFGFILRYPEGKEHITGVVFEPWHFRYVGEELAAYLYENDLTLEEFYQ